MSFHKVNGEKNMEFLPQRPRERRTLSQLPERIVQDKNPIDFEIGDFKLTDIADDKAIDETDARLILLLGKKDNEWIIPFLNHKTSYLKTHLKLTGQQTNERIRRLCLHGYLYIALPSRNDAFNLYNPTEKDIKAARFVLSEAKK